LLGSKTQAVVRAFLQEIRSENDGRRSCAGPPAPFPDESKMVELRGLEPLTPRLPGFLGPRKKTVYMSRRNVGGAG